MKVIGSPNSASKPKALSYTGQASLNNSYYNLPDPSKRTFEFPRPKRILRRSSINMQEPIERECCARKNRSMSLSVDLSPKIRKQVIENNILTVQLTNMKREQLKYCSYINSFNIDKELSQLKGKCTNLDKSEETARAITALMRLHLKRLHVKVNDKRDIGLVDLHEIKRQSNTYNSITSIDELKKEMVSLRKMVPKLRGDKSEQHASETIIKNKGLQQFKRKQGATQMELIKKLSKMRKSKAAKKEEEDWWGSFKKRCSKQITLNQSIDTMIKNAGRIYTKKYSNCGLAAKLAINEINKPDKKELARLLMGEKK